MRKYINIRWYQIERLLAGSHKLCPAHYCTRDAVEVTSVCVVAKVFCGGSLCTRQFAGERKDNSLTYNDFPSNPALYTTIFTRKEG